jgi:putative aldouronate transport system permease protein
VRHRGFRTSPSDKVFVAVKNTFLILWFVLVLYPIIYVVSASISDPLMVISGRVWLYPVKVSLDGYKTVLTDPQIGVGFRNSFIYMFTGTAINLVMTMLAAYPLSRKHLKGKGIFTTFFVFTMLFNGGLVPTYLVVKNLGFADKIWAMIIPTAMVVFNVIITRTFLQMNIPHELYEAAEIDGCSDFRAMVAIALPLSGPILAVMALYYGVGNWNSYFNALIYLTSQEKYPLQLVLRNILIKNVITPEMAANFRERAAQQSLIDVMKYSIIVVASVPVLCVYPFVERFFKKGVMIGALKG